MALSFITKVEKQLEKNHTPLDTKKLSEPKKAANTHTAVSSKSSLAKIHIPFEFDKYILIVVVSILFFLSGFGFWIYVNYFMS
ncbi:hypothetical protein COY16_00260 [Candidatus Roizmanbacteria bacterium CG_4_10_14_0_2_um_filter_39_13]|uniref:Uncharacterized protein n=1 Tax=Candidatus Roizmanbacteria bacterium CG_4_10_14_0_2_um_filter_39_13 TaxID=1974825 RepID=A0A2M7U1V4_9BACT|nr:MAG: hypothetical protein COY16_00260 [Candidatus Roizmanbacteria bacterium CG_4_10_14_0_2_um_filter_39_13]